MARISHAVEAVCVAMVSALLGLVIGTAVGGNLPPLPIFPRLGDELDFRVGMMLGGSAGAVAGFLFGFRGYRRRRHSDEAVMRYVVSLLTALTGFVLGTVLVSTMVDSINRTDRTIGGMLYGGILLSFLGFHWGRDHFRYTGTEGAPGPKP